jgi:hypothetical protein
LGDLPTTALLLFGLIGWGLSLYFGFFRFKQFVWTRHKVSYDLFTRQARRRRNLASKLQRLDALPKEGRGIDTRRQLVSVAYLELLAESTFLLRQEVVTAAQGREWMVAILNQLAELAPVSRKRLRHVNEHLPLPYPELQLLLDEANRESPRPDHILHRLLSTDRPPSAQ